MLAHIRMPFCLQRGSIMLFISACGSSLHLSQSASAIVMAPQDHNHKYQPGTVCRWSISTDSPLWLQIKIERLDLELSQDCTKDFVDVSSIGAICAANFTGMSYVLKQTQINVTFVSNMMNEEEGFLLKITSVGRYSFVSHWYKVALRVI